MRVVVAFVGLGGVLVMGGGMLVVLFRAWGRLVARIGEGGAL